MNTRREDCFYFSEVTDYGGHIPFCGVTAKLEDCTCRDCKNYITKSDAYQVVRKHQNGEIVALRHGAWVEDFMIGEGVYRCTNCDDKFVTLEGTPYDNRLFYCPFCGAKMDGKEQKK